MVIADGHELLLEILEPTLLCWHYNGVPRCWPSLMFSEFDRVGKVIPLQLTIERVTRTFSLVWCCQLEWPPNDSNNGYEKSSSDLITLTLAHTCSEAAIDFFLCTSLQPPLKSELFLRGGYKVKVTEATTVTNPPISKPDFGLISLGKSMMRAWPQ